MRIWTPSLELASCLPQQFRRAEKFGGRPWGLPEARWPRCKNCGGPMSLVAQLDHAADRLDLGAKGRALFAFQCNHDPGMCETWSAQAGANAVLVLEARDLTESLTPSPEDAGPEDVEVRVMGWT